MIESDELPGIEEFMNNKLGKKDPTGEEYCNMAEIYTYFDCKTMADLLHIYTIEDGMLLAIIMSNTFERMYASLGLDPTNFASTAKYSYVSCKRLMHMIMQTIPNGRVFNTIVQMKRAGFSMIKKQVSLASPFNEHVKTCQYSTDCVKCGPFVRDIAQGDVESLKEETYRVVKECKRALKATLSRLREVHEANEIEEDTKVLEAVEQMQGMYEILKTQSFVKSEVTSEELIETICVLQSCIIYFDENNQYGYALKQILPVGNYVWLNYSQVTGRVTIEKLQEILAEQTRKLRADRKARVVDFYTCVDIILPDTCSKADLQREEEFNLLVRNKVPEVFNFTEKMLRSKRNEYVLKGDKYRSISLYKKLMSGTEPIMKYWIHSSMLKIALTNGWKVVRVHNTLAFTAQRICEDYIQFNQDKRLMWVSRGMEFLGNFHKLMNNGFYGWFCRAVETYQETQLLMSGIDSYQHFQSQNDDMRSGLILQEQAILVIGNPHDDEAQKREKITGLFEREITKAEDRIESHRLTLKNYTYSSPVTERHLNKIAFLDNYIAEIRARKRRSTLGAQIDIGIGRKGAQS